MAMISSTVVEHSTHNPKNKGLNYAIGTRRDKIGRKGIKQAQLRLTVQIWLE
jgi:hypothetical protein